MVYPHTISGRGKTWATALLIDHWCKENCIHPYRLQHKAPYENTVEVDVSFSFKEDLVRFMFSRAYSYLAIQENT